MSVVTEHYLREQWRKNSQDVIEVPQGAIVTPSAREFLNEKKIELKFTGEDGDKNVPFTSTAHTEIPKVEHKYRLYGTEAYIDEKPEMMTALFGNQLVYKDHPRIRYRGKIDSFESELLYTRALMKEMDRETICQGLDDLYKYTRRLMRAEVLGEDLEDFVVLGFDADRVREFTHNPQKYFGIPHLMLTGDEPKEILLLNRLRAKIREVELSAYEVFRKEDKFEREDILKALNRLSSGFYFLMLLSLSKKFNP